MLKEQVIDTIKKYNLIKNGDKVVIGVSGGPDSISLLYILNQIKNEFNFEIYVAHINHKIRKEADEETEYVKEVCKNLGIKCYIKRIDVTKIANNLKRGTEEAGRQIRYEFFNEVLEKTNSNKIATAHNNNDKVETILMNILRGSGSNGLKGIEPIRDGKYIRPLINSSREEIEEYCIKNKLEPKIDKSNNENIYTRNKIRNIVIPYIKKEFNPNIIKTINRLSEVANEENEYLEKITAQTFKEIRVDEQSSHKSLKEVIQKEDKQIILDLKKFNSLELVIKRRIILYTINELLSSTTGIEKVNIDDIVKLCNNNIGNKYLQPIKKLKILVKKGKIFFIA